MTPSAQDVSESGTPSARALRARLFRQLRDKGFRPDFIVDAGAHRGEWSRDARDVFPEARFTLVEPLAEMKPYLDEFCSSAENARWLLAGVARSGGELPLTITSPSDGSGFIYPEAYAKERGLERRLVKVLSLDEICAGGPAPDIVKLDVEGFELEAMAGAGTLLGRTELFFLEAALFDFGGRPLIHEVIGYLRSVGYEPYDLTDLNRRPSDSALGLVELAFARRSGRLRDHNSW